MARNLHFPFPHLLSAEEYSVKTLSILTPTQMATVSEITEPAIGDTGERAETTDLRPGTTTSSGGSSLKQHLNGLKFWKRKPTYPYSPVGSASKEIRVLDLQPGNLEDKIRCTLRKVSLLDDPLPVYETISYTWGDSSGLKSIGIDQYNTAVPRSTEEVLRRFRKQNRVRTLWVSRSKFKLSFVAPIASLEFFFGVYLEEALFEW